MGRAQVTPGRPSASTAGLLRGFLLWPFPAELCLARRAADILTGDNGDSSAGECFPHPTGLHPFMPGTALEKLPSMLQNPGVKLLLTLQPSLELLPLRCLLGPPFLIALTVIGQKLFIYISKSLGIPGSGTA